MMSTLSEESIKFDKCPIKIQGMTLQAASPDQGSALNQSGMPSEH